jgi:hypothetical protein
MCESTLAQLGMLNLILTVLIAVLIISLIEWRNVHLAPEKRLHPDYRVWLAGGGTAFMVILHFTQRWFLGC